jgi:hypothetical protein
MDFADPDFYMFWVKLGRSVFHRLIYIVSFVALQKGVILFKGNLQSRSSQPLNLPCALKLHLCFLANQ